MMELDPRTILSAKRGRTGFTTQRKRPIDKSIIAISKDTVDATDVTTTLLTTTFPCTVTGLRWQLSFSQDGGTAAAFFHWAIVIVRDGVTVSTLTISDAGKFFDPEQNCLTWGVGTIDNNTETITHTGSTKTMRKMMGGDILMFVYKGRATNTSGCRGIIQFFCKT